MLAENVGVGSSVTRVHSEFMRSSPHRANILYSRFRYFGLNVYRAHGRMWVTVEFESRRNPGTTLSMPRC